MLGKPGITDPLMGDGWFGVKENNRIRDLVSVYKWVDSHKWHDEIV